MNAHDRLRLYLEQRRELGESELVLDGLPVDAVLKLLGAPGGKSDGARANTNAPASPVRGAAPSESQRSATDNAATTEAPGVASPSGDAPVALPPVEPAPRFDSTATVDWRAALSGLAPGADQKAAPRNVPERAPVERATPLPNSSPQDADTSSPLSGTTANNSTSSSATNPAQPSLIATTADFPAWLMNLGMPAGLSAIAVGESVTSAAANASNTLDELATVIAGCGACALGASAINPVPGEGNHNADFVCVGEAPGQTEDETGRPFIGAAGDLLTKILAAIQLPREEVFICNVLKHRPPGNRNPLPDEIHACTPYLTRQLSLIKPKVILALGTFAAQTLLNTTTTLGKLRGQVHRYQGIPLIVTYHPAALLRNEHWKRPTWDDVKLARKILDASRAEDSRNASTAS